MGIDIISLVITFFLFLLLGIPISATIALASLITMLISLPPNLVLPSAAANVVQGVNSFTLLAIPFFILSGNIMNHGGLAIRLINFTKLFIGNIPGSLCYVNVITNMLFGALSGSSAAAAAAVGKVLTPLQKKENYNMEIASAINAASAPSGLLIPPSSALIIYSLVSGGTSVAALFMAGYIPGIFMGLAAMGTTFYFFRSMPVPKKKSLSFRQVIKIIYEAIPSLLLIVLIVGGIGVGIFTPTEASAVAVLYSVVLALCYKTLTKENIANIIEETVILSGIVLFLIATSGMLSWVLSFSGMPQKIASGVLSISDNPVVILLLINIILLIAGMFIDMAAAILIFTPIFLPIALSLGMNSVHFGIILVFNLCIGLITPPIGSTLFVACSVGEVSVTQIIKYIIPVSISMIVVLLFVTFIPELSLWLPRVFNLL